MKHFSIGSEIPMKDFAEGIRRQILGYTSNLMMVNVYFEEGAVAASHSHPHQQVGHVLKGKFEVEIEGEVKKLSEGDCFIVQENLTHRALCLEEGIILDTFSPMREDFLE
ncbi:cupin domain-containing protein [candidate division KSB1 bacterium]|nr:cupin domain-containing protein [candidate division KSB1 bacterium]